VKREQCLDHLKEIFLSGIKQVDPQEMILSQVFLKGDLLKVRLPGQTLDVDLSPFKRILLIGAGKASAKMARAFETLLKERLKRGIISVKQKPKEALYKTRIITAGHPVPDEASCQAAREILALVKEADKETLIINCLSGGGSSLLSLPYQDSHLKITLEEKQAVTRLLLECGATIQEINCVRKHLSAIKGGRLARSIYPAPCLSFILSDVVGDPLDSIASGITAADKTTYSDAKGIVEKYNLTGSLPSAVRELITRGVKGDIPETVKEGDPVLKGITNILIGTNRAALLGAGKRAEELGYNTVFLSSRIIGETREIAKFYCALALDTARHQMLLAKPACIIGGGETTVTLKGTGQGGRNQEMALAFLRELSHAGEGGRGIYFLSAGTDGNDGPTDAAGAFAYSDLADRGRESGLSIDSYLKNNDSYNYFKAVEGLLVTGMTDTNVGDLQVVLVV